MRQKKFYIYSEDTLSYKEVYKNTIELYVKNYPLFIFGFICCIGIVSILSQFIDSPKEHALKNENNQLKENLYLLSSHIDDLEKRYEDLSTKDDSLYRMILGEKPLTKEQKNGGTGGSREIDADETDKNDSISQTIAQNIKQLKAKYAVLQHSYNDILHKAQQNIDKMKHMPAIIPIYTKSLQSIGSGFGMRKHPILNITRMHEGQDFYARTGTKVYATADGVVTHCKVSKTFGNLVIIDHGNGIETYYAHLNSFNVKKGQTVKRGQTIAEVGNTGLSSGQHLHYEVHIHGKEVNPAYYFFGNLTTDEYNKVLQLCSRDICSMD